MANPSLARRATVDFGQSRLPQAMKSEVEFEMVNWYRSKIDWWIGLVLCLPPVAAMSACLGLALDGKTSELWIGGVGVIAVFGIYIGLIFPMRYGLDASYLIVRFGLCRRWIPLADISDVHTTRNPLSSPALSLDRLHVQFGKSFFKSVLISPANRDRFLDELAQKAKLKRDGDRLFRA